MGSSLPNSVQSEGLGLAVTSSDRLHNESGGPGGASAAGSWRPVLSCFCFCGGHFTAPWEAAANFPSLGRPRELR